MSGSPRSSMGNVRSDMDIAYPEPLSRLHRHTILAEYPKAHKIQKKNIRNRRGNRYRTQPVTFDEIQEVDEEVGDDNPSLEEVSQSNTPTILTTDLQMDFFRFSKEISKKFDSTKVNEKDSPGNSALEQLQTVKQNVPKDTGIWTSKGRQGSI